MKHGVLARLALFSSRHFRWVMVGFALLAVLSIGLATRLRFDADVLKLLPRKDPVIQAFVESLQRFGSVDYLLVAIRLPEDVVPDPYESYADRLAERLKTLEEVESVEYQIGSPEELVETIFPKAMLFLDEEGRAQLDERFSPQGLVSRARELRRLLSTPQAIAIKQLLQIDPYGLSTLFMDHLGTNQSALSIDWTSGYYLSQDHRMLLLLTKPTSPPQDTDFDARLVAAVEAASAAVDAEWPDIVGESDLVGPQVALGGPYLTALDDYTFIRGDMIFNSVTSMAAVLLLFLFAFRRFGPLLYAFLPLVGGLVMTFGFSALTIGELSSATSGTAALLIGLGIDFVIVSYGRYVEERRQGQDVEGALAVMASTSGRAVLIGAVTTGATFFAFLVTDFQGLRQMGFLTGTGILFCMLAVLTLLPALLTWSERRHQRRETDPNLYLHSFGIGGMVRASFARPKLMLTIGALVTVVAGLLAFRIEFEEGMTAMRPEKGNRGIDVAEEVADHYRTGFDSMSLMLRADDLEEVFSLTEEAAAGAQRLVDEGVINAQSSLVSLIPSPERQREAIAWLDRGRASGALDPKRIDTDFRAALTEAGVRATPFEAGLDLMREALSPTEPIAPDDLAGSEQAAKFLDRYLQRDGDGWISVVTMSPPLNKWRREPPPEAVALAEELGPKVVLTGANVVNQHLRARVRVDAVVAALVGLLLVGILLWIDFQSIEGALLALSPLLIGIVWMLGGMAILGLKMNFMNIFVTTMIIGIGVDYGVHAVHRYREAAASRTLDLEEGLVETSKAIVIAALSTIAGFGSLSFSHYPGLQSTGKVAILGALATAWVAVTLLPAYLALRKR